MESSVSVNLVTIGRDGRPQQKSLRGVLAEWIDFRFDTVRRRCEHRLAQVDERIHVLEGRMLVLLNVDEVIRVIRNADEPKPELMSAFKLTERQAEDILEMRLRQLARLEGAAQGQGPEGWGEAVPCSGSAQGPEAGRRCLCRLLSAQ